MNKFVISSNEANLRLDKCLSLLMESTSRSKIQEYIDNGLILVNQKVEKASYKVQENDEIIVNEIPKKENTLTPKDIKLDIVYEDDDLLVINKPKGMVTHPGNGNEEDTLANAVSFYSNSLSHVNGDFRPGIVHRLDKDTAGLLVVAKNDEAHAFLADQLVDHTLGRLYYALVLGNITEEEGVIIAPIGRDKQNRLKMAVDVKNGKEAETTFRVIERLNGFTFVECKLKTGRTHQIRVHLDYIGHPVIGDPIYGKGNRKLYNDGQLLFAHKISFIRPSDKKMVTFEAPLPDYFQEVLDELRS